jgi:hypothetical protein
LLPEAIEPQTRKLPPAMLAAFRLLDSPREREVALQHVAATRWQSTSAW